MHEPFYDGHRQPKKKKSYSEPTYCTEKYNNDDNYGIAVQTAIKKISSGQLQGNIREYQEISGEIQGV